MEFEKHRMERFMSKEEEEDTYFDLTQLKGHLKTLPPNERHKVKNFERLRNLADGIDPNEGMDVIDSVIRELDEEEHDIVKALVQKRICMTLAMKGHQGQEKNTTTTGKSNAKQALREKNQPQPEN